MRLTAAVASGLVLSTAFPKPDVGVAAWFALVPLLAAVGTAEGWRERFWLGYTAGLAFFGALVAWCTLFGYAAWVGLAATEALFTAVFAVLAGPLARRGGSVCVFGVPAVWVVVEWIRSLGPLGFTWGALAVSQHRNLAVLQAASVGGPYLLSFLVAMVNGLILELARPILFPYPCRRSGVLASAAALVAIALLVLCGWARLRGTEPPKGGRDLTVGIVQAGINKEQGGQFADPEAVMRAHSRLTRHLAYYHADVVVWPETAVPGLALKDAVLRARLANLARRCGVYLMLGSFDTEEGGRLANCVVAFDRQGNACGRYAKVRLVPFGEYVPVPWARPFLRRWGVPEEDLVGGKSREPIRLGDLPVGVLICFESAHAGAARQQVRGGSELLVVVTNDAWFGESAAPYQHLAFSALRAVETGRYVVRAATTGVSACFDPWGRPVVQGKLGGEAALLACVERLDRQTPYVRFGDWPVWLSVLLAAACLASAYGKRADDDV
ncbi:MAG: apolipoprotein N-acyltransferase [Armatimonadota bacterium]